MTAAFMHGTCWKHNREEKGVRETDADAAAGFLEGDVVSRD